VLLFIRFNCFLCFPAQLAGLRGRKLKRIYITKSVGKYNLFFVAIPAGGEKRPLAKSRNLLIKADCQRAALGLY
jgi:hypothetical protein